MADVSQIKLPNGDTFDLIDEKSGYITAQYIENRTDYSIPVSRVGEIVVGETAIGTDSTNFPTSKAVVDYVDERVVQEIGAIDVGVTGIKANGTSLVVNNGVVNIPVAGKTQTIGLMDFNLLASFQDYLESQIPTSTSQLTNDSGFITSYSDEKVKQQHVSSGIIRSLLLAANSNTSDITSFAYKHTDLAYGFDEDGGVLFTPNIWVGIGTQTGKIRLGPTYLIGPSAGSDSIITFPAATGTVALTSDIPSVPSWALQSRKPTYTANEVGALPSTTVIPSKTSDLTNDSGYLTASDIASVMSYKGTKANYAALPSTGNTTGDVWHLTDTGAEWAWDGSAWQELGTAIDLSGYLTKSEIADWAKQSTKPTYTAAEVGAISTSHVVNGITSTDISNWNGKIDNQYIGYLDNHNLYIPKEWTYYSGTSRFSYYVPFYVKGTNTPTISSTSKVRTIGTTTDLFSFGTIFIDNVKQSGTVTLEENKLYMYHLSDGETEIYTVANLSDIPDTSSFLTSETDPVFSASAAAGISATDISNWNGKVNKSGDTMTGNLTMGDNELLFIHDGKTIGIKGTHYYQSNYDTTYYGISFRVGSSNAILLRNVKSPITDSDAANKAYVDSAVGGITVPTKTSELTNDSGFITSYTDEKVKTESVTNDGNARYLVFGSNTGNAETKYHSNALRYALLENNYALFSVGDYSHPGRIHIESGDRNTGNGVNLVTSATTGRTITLPDATGTVALTSDLPTRYTSSNTTGYLTMADLPIWDGTVVMS